MSRRGLYFALGGIAIIVILFLLLIADRHVAVRVPQVPQRHSAGQLVVGAESAVPTVSASPSSGSVASATAPASIPQQTAPPAKKSPVPPTAMPSGIGEESVPVIYDRSDQGSVVTQDFQVPAQWIIYWSYACTGADTEAGRLGISVYRKGVDLPLKSFSNQLDQSRGQDYDYVGDGWYHLSVQSACAWRITVTAAPGFSATATPSP
ncbi:MAG: hypothetical protein M3082_21000 [Candidatus Dormibacteraeota bacterium]|nr:hypothetical protein [Candidatus Dormibacteraeota bacterium]